MFTSRIIGIPQLNIIRDDPRLSWIGWFSIPLLLAFFLFLVYGSSGESSKIESRLSELRKVKYRIEKQYLFEPERSQRINRISQEINEVKGQYEKSDKSRAKVGTFASRTIFLLLIAVFFLSTQTTF